MGRRPLGPAPAAPRSRSVRRRVLAAQRVRHAYLRGRDHRRPQTRNQRPPKSPTHRRPRHPPPIHPLRPNRTRQSPIESVSRVPPRLLRINNVFASVALRAPMSRCEVCPCPTPASIIMTADCVTTSQVQMMRARPARLTSNGRLFRPHGPYAIIPPSNVTQGAFSRCSHGKGSFFQAYKLSLRTLSMSLLCQS